ncbi:MAG TPA: SHOCT domain-containing protein [Acidimicrobiia bacterium]|jgi:hypothetical protein
MARGAAVVAVELAQSLNAYEADGGGDPLIGVIALDEFRPFVDLDASDTNFSRPNGRWTLVVTNGRELAVVDGQPQRAWRVLDRERAAETGPRLIERANRLGVRREASAYFQCESCATPYREGSGFCIECGAKRDTERFSPAGVARRSRSSRDAPAPVNQRRSPVFAVREIDYLGSHPGYPNWFPRAHLVLDADGLRVTALGTEPLQNIAMALASILGVEIMSASEARLRVMAPRVLLLGGLTTPEDPWRERDTSFISVRTDTGDLVFRARGQTPNRLRVAVQPFASALPRWARSAAAASSAPVAAPSAPEAVATPTVDDFEARLKKLDQLHERGIISDDEHERRRSAILDQI